MLSSKDFKVPSLGKCRVPSPLKLSDTPGDGLANFLPDESFVFYQNEIIPGCKRVPDLMFEKAGPRQRIFFEPPKTRAALVTCGGLSPGLNGVIRSICLELHHHYGVRDILGIQYGFKGLNPANGYEPIPLSLDKVSNIHRFGGTLLGSSRGAEDVSVLADALYDLGIDILFCIGGDGTLKGAHAIHGELQKRHYRKSVIGIPKTIDNDISYVDMTFGFDTAIGIARDVLTSAHSEALGAPNGIGLVKLMGRDSGFVAAYASLASLEVNFVLIPESPFDLDGENGLFRHLRERLEKRRHAVIVVAEGAGQEIMPAGVKQRDASGNLKHQDIGIYLADQIREYSARNGLDWTLKYIDPSYFIRSVPANANDSIYCDSLARNAVHAGMAGKTDIVIGNWNGSATHVPIPLATSSRKKIRPESELWRSVCEATGQPPSMKSSPVSKS